MLSNRRPRIAHTVDLTPIAKAILSTATRWTGQLTNFAGEEVILEAGTEIYRARYFGGLVDQRQGD